MNFYFDFFILNIIPYFQVKFNGLWRGEERGGFEVEIVLAARLARSFAQQKQPREGTGSGRRWSGQLPVLRPKPLPSQIFPLHTLLLSLPLAPHPPLNYPKTMKKWFTDLIGTPIALRKTPFKVGRLLELVVHPDDGSLVALITTKRRAIAPVDLGPFERDMFTVREPDVLIPPSELVRLKSLPKEKRRLLGKNVVTKSGQRLGRTYDLAFDMETFSLVQFLVTRKWFLFLTLEKRILSFKDIVEITEEAIIVKDRSATQKVGSKKLKQSKAGAPMA